MEELKNVHYDAFISYRHCELDSFVAEHLHRKLEKFKLPKSVRSKVKSGKTGISRVFRDVDELPLSDNLSDPINNAIANTDFLITICTPRYPESRWCMKEIELFLQTHPRDHILVVLAEDEPVNSFPEILTYEEFTRLDENGNEVKERKEIEPLAADTRGENHKEILKAMDTAVIKLCAAIFGLNYDDLKQRHREQKIRQMATIFGSIGAAVLAFAVFATVMLIRIANQNRVITEQYAELNDKYAGSMANAAEQLLGEGKRKDAVYAVRNSLPDTADGNVNVNALGKLYKAMAIYDNGNLYNPESAYDIGEEVASFDVSCDNKYVLVSDMGHAYIFDAETEKLVMPLKKESKDPYSFLVTSFCGPEGIIFAEDTYANYFNFVTEEIKPLEGLNGNWNYFPSPDGEMTVAIDVYDGIIKGVGKEGDILYTVDVNELFNEVGLSHQGYVVIKEGKVLTFFSGTDHFYVFLFDEKTGERIAIFQGEGDMQLTGDFEGDNICFSATPLASNDSSVFLADISTNSVVWSRQEDGILFDRITMAGDFIYLNDAFRVEVLDKRLGEKFNLYEVDYQIIACWPSEDYLHFLTENGKEYQCDANYYVDYSGGFFNVQPTGHILEARFVNDELFARFNRGSYITRYAKKKDAPEPFNGDDYEIDVFYEYDASDVMAAADLSDERYYGYDLCFFSTDRKYIVATYSNHVVRIFDAATMEAVAALDITDSELISLKYFESLGGYVLSSSVYSYILDKNFKLLYRSDFIIAEEGDEIITGYEYSDKYRFDVVKYEELIRMADEYLGDYEPSPETKEKYSIR